MKPLSQAKTEPCFEIVKWLLTRVLQAQKIVSSGYSVMKINQCMNFLFWLELVPQNHIVLSLKVLIYVSKIKIQKTAFLLFVDHLKVQIAAI